MAKLFITVVLAVLLLGACGNDIVSNADDDDHKFDTAQPGASNQTAATKTPSPSTSGNGIETGAADSAPPADTNQNERPAPTATPTPSPTATPTLTPTPSPTATPSPTPTPTPIPAQFEQTSFSATVGEETTLLLATASQGRIIEVSAEALPLRAPDLDAGNDIFGLGGLAKQINFETTSNGQAEITINADRAGTVNYLLTLKTNHGANTTEQVTVTATWPHHPNSLISMGDSVASGHGLELADYLGNDPCWRSKIAYPKRVFNALIEHGYLEAERAEFALLACSGADVDDLWERTVTGGLPRTAPTSGNLSQLEWAVKANPGLVTVTIGANDTGFVGPARLFIENTAELDHDQVSRRMNVIETDLRITLNRLVNSTDSTIFISNYYNPVSQTPHGTPKCSGQCFLEAANHVVGLLNKTIAEVADEFPNNRVVLVDFATPFEGKGAPNGLGDDDLRADGYGQFGDAFGLNRIADIHPYCAKGHPETESWINPIDCVHPDEQGTFELASIMFNAIVKNTTG